MPRGRKVQDTTQPVDQGQAQPEPTQNEPQAQPEQETKPQKTSKATLESLATALAVQCKTSVDNIDHIREENGINYFGYKENEFIVLSKIDFDSTAKKSWKVVVDEKEYFIYLVK